MIPDKITAKNVRSLTLVELDCILSSVRVSANHIEWFSRDGYRKELRFLEMLEREMARRLERENFRLGHLKSQIQDDFETVVYGPGIGQHSAIQHKKD